MLVLACQKHGQCKEAHLPLSSNPAAPPQSAVTLDPQTQRALRKAYATVPDARKLVAGARKHLASSLAFVNGHPSHGHVDEDRFSALNVYFNLDQLTKHQAATYLRFIDAIFHRMQRALATVGTYGSPHGVFRPDPDPAQHPNWYAYTYPGGYHHGGGRGAIYIEAILDRQDGGFTAFNTVHEMAHWVGPADGHRSILDFSYRHKHGFYELPPQTALRTADCYAMFAMAASQPGLAEDNTRYMAPMVIRGSAKQ